jgi:hypothetical protein
MLRDPSWVKSRIAARILLRRHFNRVTTRDRRLGRRFVNDPGVTDRLVDQALASICAQKRIPLHEYRSILDATLAAAAQLEHARREVA